MLCVQGQPGLRSETPATKQNGNKKAMSPKRDKESRKPGPDPVSSSVQAQSQVQSCLQANKYMKQSPGRQALGWCHRGAFGVFLLGGTVVSGRSRGLGPGESVLPGPRGSGSRHIVFQADHLSLDRTQEAINSTCNYPSWVCAHQRRCPAPPTPGPCTATRGHCAP